MPTATIVSDSVRAKVVQLAATSPTEARKYLGEATGLKKSRRDELFREIVGGKGPVASAAKQNTDDGAMDVEVETSDIRTVEEVVKLCGVDLEKWESKGFTVTKRAKGFGWSSRFAKRVVQPSTREEVEVLKAEFKAFVQPTKEKRAAKDNGGEVLLELALMDLHFGKLGWDEEVGENYDSKIAAKRYKTAVYDLVEKARKQGTINKILLPAGNDYLHVDTQELTTSLGTRQDADTRFTRIFREGRKLLVETIEYLKTVAPVDVLICVGNHDGSAMFHLGDALECWFHADPLVTVDNSPALRKYYRYGNTVIGFTHSDKEKPKELPLLGAMERPKDWAECSFREWHLGHRHGEACTEDKGVKVRTIASLCGPDVWHFGHGYCGNIKSAEGFVFHKEDGLAAHLYHYAKE